MTERQHDLIDAVENVLIAYSMGWDLEGVMTRLKDVLLENWRVSNIDADAGTLRNCSGQSRMALER